MKFREHRGTLEQAMLTVVEVNSLEELATHIQKIWGSFTSIPIRKKDIYFRWLCYDERIGWDTYFVYVNQIGSVGYSNGKFDISQKVKSGEQKN